MIWKMWIRSTKPVANDSGHKLFAAMNIKKLQTCERRHLTYIWPIQINRTFWNILKSRIITIFKRFLNGCLSLKISRLSIDKWAPFVVRVEAKLINCHFSPLTLVSWLRTANIGLSMSDSHPNHVINFKQAKLIREIACARPTSKGRKGRSPKTWFSNGMMAEKPKERAAIFSPSEKSIIMSLYEDNKHSIMARSNTAARARQPAWRKIAKNV